MTTYDENTANMKSILDFCDKTLKLSTMQAGPMLFSLAIQLRYADMRNLGRLHDQLAIDIEFLRQTAVAAFMNNHHLRED